MMEKKAIKFFKNQYFFKKKKILSYVLWRTLPVAIICLLIIWYWVAIFAENKFEEERLIRLDQQAGHYHNYLHSKLDKLKEVSASLSNSGIIKESLLGTEIQTQYLSILLNELSSYGGVEADILVINEKREAIFQDPPEASQRWKDILNQNLIKQSITIQPDYLLISTPITQKNEVLGYVLINLDKNKMNRFFSQSIDAAIHVQNSQGLIFTNMYGEIPPVEYSKDFLSIKRKIEPYDLEISFYFLKDEMLSPVSFLKKFLLLSGFLNLTLLIVCIILAGLMINRPLTTLVHKIRSIRTSKNLGKTIEEDSFDEINRIARTLNQANKSLKKEIESNHQLLEKKIDLERQVMQMQKMESLGQFAGGIAHEFNNMLAPMMLMTETVKENLTDEHDIQFLDNVLSNGDKAQSLVNKIMNYSRTNTDDEEIFSVKDAVEQAGDIITNVIPSSIAFRKEIFVNDEKMKGSATELHQIMMNLCSNAADAIEGKNGIIRLTIVIKSADEINKPNLKEAKKYLIIEVEDTGSGMDEKTKAKVFNPFFTTKAVGKGTGLGLSVIFEIVKRYGGIIDLNSERHIGTTFTVCLPILEDTVYDEKQSIIEEEANKYASA